MTRLAKLEIHKEAFSFSAGHFTIFSATEREQLHGHNYNVGVEFEFELIENGLAFDYREYKRKIKALCDKVDRHFLLPEKSAYLSLREEGNYIIALYNQQRLPFLREDVITLPVSNVTIEELSDWFLQELTKDQTALARHRISNVKVSVSNGPDQSASAMWIKASSNKNSNSLPLSA